MWTAYLAHQETIQTKQDKNSNVRKQILNGPLISDLNRSFSEDLAEQI